MGQTLTLSRFSLKVQIEMQEIDLYALFEQVNKKHFESFLSPPVIRWNSRLRSSAGRFIPGSRKWFMEFPPAIEIASYLRGRPDAFEMILDTMGHEVIHYWLWIRRRPYGHNAEFWKKMTEMGVSRYNPVPVRRPYRHLYRCRGCSKEFKVRKKLSRALACAECCKVHNRGRFDERYRLEWVSNLSLEVSC